MRCFWFRSRVRRPPPLLPRAAAIPPRRRAESRRRRRRRRSLESDPRLRRWAPQSRREMDPQSESASAAAPAAGATSPSLPHLTLCFVSDLLCVQEQEQENAAAEPPRSPRPDAMAAEKRGISLAEYELVVEARLRRRRTSVVAVEAPEVAASTKPTPSAERNDAVPAVNTNPSISDATGSNNSDHHGSSTTNPPRSARGAAGESAAVGGGIGSVKSYKRISILGAGGFGTVWKARDTSTGELVAMKSSNKAEDSAALLREAALLAACRGNPAVVGFREVLRGPGLDNVHIVMDLVGPSLRGLLDSGRRFTEPETRGAMRQLLAAVDKMGKQGIIHGDLKPDNLLLRNRDGRIIFIVCDLGLAVSVAELPCHIQGTVWYSAPEQLLGDKSCGPPVDAWALGCIMVELLTGEPLARKFTDVEQFIETVFILAIPDEVTRMSNGVDASTPSELRSRVPEEVLTQPGFDVLQGLMQYDCNDRLTPAAALQMPWFAEEEAPGSF